MCLICALWLGVAAGAAVAAPPPNDNLASAQVLSGPLPLRVAGTTVGATREAGEPTHPGWVPSGHSVWYRWQASATEYISINTCGSEQRETLVVYDGSAYGALTEIAANAYTYIPGCESGGESEVSFTAVAGHAYSISVDGDGRWSEDPSSTGEGSIELQVSRPAPPVNDDFVGATPVTAGELGFPIDNHGATKEPGEPAHRGNEGGASVWFRWTAPRSGGVNVRACYEDDGLVAVYTGSSVAALTLVPQTGAFDTCDYSFFATAGVTYRIAFDGKLDVATGAAELLTSHGEVRYFPTNDEFEEAVAIENPFTHQAFTEVTMIGYGTSGATKQPGEPNHAGDPGGASVWFEWTAPETGSVQMSACEAEFSPLLAVYVGDTLAQLTPIASAVGSPGAQCPTDPLATGQVGFDIHEGVTYDIAVDGVGGASGRYDFDLWASNERLRRTATKPAAPSPTSSPAVRHKSPKTAITARHIDRSRNSVTFRLSSYPKGASFRCKLDRRKFTRCGPKVTYRHLASGRHTFEAEAVGPTGLADPTPTRAEFSLAKRHVHRR